MSKDYFELEVSFDTLNYTVDIDLDDLWYFERCKTRQDVKNCLIDLLPDRNILPDIVTPIYKDKEEYKKVLNSICEKLAPRFEKIKEQMEHKEKKRRERTEEKEKKLLAKLEQKYKGSKK